VSGTRAVRALHVIQLLPALEAGGAEQSTLEVVAALVRDGHRATVISAGGRLVPTVQALGGRHITLPIGRKSPQVLRFWPALRRYCADADIVHARSRLPAWLGWLALRSLPASQRPAFITTVHGLNSPSAYSAIMVRGERVICVSQTVRAHVLRHYPKVDPARLVVVPRGIDPARFARRAWPDRAARARIAQRHPALAGTGPLLLLPGRGTRRKGHADAIALLAALRARGLDARLWLAGAVQAGREAYRDELQAQARAAGVEVALAITPPEEAMHEAYAACDLVLQLSRHPEAFGRTVIEALAVGRPVLGWNHGGVGEVLQTLLPDGALPPFDQTLLIERAQAWCTQPPSLPATLPYSLQAMQQATLAQYREVWDASER
jgi:glycosyltransferase involved in cell wall biosynthesis